MASSGMIELDGEVVEVLPDRMYRISLDNGEVVLAEALGAGPDHWKGESKRRPIGMTMAMEEMRAAGSGLDANGRVRVVTEVVHLGEMAARALDVIQREDLPYLPVVAEDTGKLVGVAMRKGLERGCQPMGHDPEQCPLQTHLKTGVEFWFDDQALDEDVLELANREPVVVVGRDLKPLAIVEAEAA